MKCKTQIYNLIAKSTSYKSKLVVLKSYRAANSLGRGLSKHRLLTPQPDTDFSEMTRMDKK